jgi:hypothetical protein
VGDWADGKARDWLEHHMTGDDDSDYVSLAAMLREVEWDALARGGSDRHDLAQAAQERMRLELVRMDGLARERKAEVERLREVVDAELAYRHTVEAQVIGLSAQANQLEIEAGTAQNALLQIDHETRSASDVTVLRLGSIARAALEQSK